MDPTSPNVTFLGSKVAWPASEVRTSDALAFFSALTLPSVKAAKKQIMER
jgi:hypothetical protein